jgi:hypothetical protein
MLTENDQRLEAIGEQLRAKISSKFQVAALLAGFAFTVLCLQVDMLWADRKKTLLLAGSIFLMVAALVLYIFSLMRLDALTMPKRFWEEEEENLKEDAKMKDKGDPVEKLWMLTKEELWTLQKRMKCYWNYLTKTAIYLMGFSLLLLLWTPGDAGKFETQNEWIFVHTAIASVLISLIYSSIVVWIASNKGKMVRIKD